MGPGQDRGTQYTSEAMQTYCQISGITQTMGRVATCFDNSAAESFFASLEKELLRRTPVFATREHARHAILMYITTYNNYRLHSTLDYHTPAEFEQLPKPQQDAILKKAKAKAETRRKKVIEKIKARNHKAPQTQAS